MGVATYSADAWSSYPLCGSGEKMRKWRAKHGLSINQLAVLFGVSSHTMIRLEDQRFHKGFIKAAVNLQLERIKMIEFMAKPAEASNEF